MSWKTFSLLPLLSSILYLHHTCYCFAIAIIAVVVTLLSPAAYLQWLFLLVLNQAVRQSDARPAFQLAFQLAIQLLAGTSQL